MLKVVISTECHFFLTKNNKMETRKHICVIALFHKSVNWNHQVDPMCVCLQDKLCVHDITSWITHCTLTKIEAKYSYFTNKYPNRYEIAIITLKHTLVYPVLLSLIVQSSMYCFLCFCFYWLFSSGHIDKTSLLMTRTYGKICFAVRWFYNMNSH